MLKMLQHMYLFYNWLQYEGIDPESQYLIVGWKKEDALSVDRRIT